MKISLYSKSLRGVGVGGSIGGGTLSAKRWSAPPRIESVHVCGCWCLFRQKRVVTFFFSDSGFAAIYALYLFPHTHSLAVIYMLSGIFIAYSECSLYIYGF